MMYMYLFTSELTMRSRKIMNILNRIEFNAAEEAGICCLT